MKPSTPVFYRTLGILLLIAGVLCNEWLLAALLTVDGTIEPGLSLYVIRGSAVLLLACGSSLIYFRHRLRPISANGPLLFIGMSVLMLIGGELLLRITGYQVWQPYGYTQPVIEPDGPFYQVDEVLGYTHTSGTYSIALADDFLFGVTHDEQTLRVTEPVDPYWMEDNREEIWVFGGSFTHGWAVSDHETYPWLLQQALPTYKVVNFGVGGYGTVHSLLQLQQALTVRTPPAMVIIGFSAYLHDPRNTYVRARRKEVIYTNKLGPFKMPAARFDENEALEVYHTDLDYTPFPFMRYSTLMHLLERAYNNIEQRLARSHDVSFAVLQEIASLAKEHDAVFLVAGVYNDPGTADVLQRFDQLGTPNVDLSVDLTVPEHYNLPYDRHPSPQANRVFASKLVPAVSRLLPIKHISQ